MGKLSAEQIHEARDKYGHIIKDRILASQGDKEASRRIREAGDDITRRFLDVKTVEEAQQVGHEFRQFHRAAYGSARGKSKRRT